MIAEVLEISRETAGLIPIENLGMKKVCAGMVSKNLTFKQGVFVEKINCVHGTHIHLPDLAPCDFFLLHSMKKYLRGLHFDTMEGIWKVILTILNSLQENGFW
jgi:hypothetical protein